MSIINTLDIVIVNWNAGTQLQDCLCSIAAADRRGVSLGKVIVVDNGSTDGSCEKINDTELPLIVIKNRRNEGFAKACNQGARYGNSDCLLFLNPDVRLFEESLIKPVKFLQYRRNENPGIVGIQLVDGSGKVSRSCARFPKFKTMLQQIAGLDRIAPKLFHGHFMTEWRHNETRRVDQVMGAFFMVRRNLFEMLGGFDERFFVYYEDMDFSFRAKCAGYSSWYIADAAAFHRGCGTSDLVKAERLFYYMRSRILYGFKHFGRKQGILLLITTLLFESLIQLVVASLRWTTKEVTDTWKAFLMLFREVPALADQKGKKRGAQCKSFS